MGDQNHLSLQQGSDLHCSARSSLLRAAHLLGFSGGLHRKDPVGDERHGHALPPPALLGEDRHDHRSPVYGKTHYGRWRRLDGGRVQRHERSDEQLRLLDAIWQDEHATFHGQHYNFDDIAFSPKPYQKPRIPIWVGGEGKLAQRRAGRHGDAWFPYFVRITPRELAARFENVRGCALEAGRNPDEITFACCLPVELTPKDVSQESDYLKGSIAQITEALKKFQDVGVSHVGLQFMIPHYPERQEQIERFAKEALPALRA